MRQDVGKVVFLILINDLLFAVRKKQFIKLFWLHSISFRFVGIQNLYALML